MAGAPVDFAREEMRTRRQVNRAIVCIIFILLFGLHVFAQPYRSGVTPPVGNEGTEQTSGEKSPAGEEDAAAPGAGGEKDVIEMKDIHDIKPPEEIGIDLTFYYWFFGTILVLAAITGLVIWLLRRKRKTKEREFVRLPPDEIALNLLDEMIEVEKFDGKEFYFRLSAILRGYIGGRYGFNAPEMTTEELMPAIDKLDADRKLLKGLKDLMVSSDPIKFAGLYAVENKMKNDLKFARNFVNETKQREVESETVNRQPSTVNR